MSAWRRLLHAVVLPLLLVGVWWAVTRVVKSFFVPTPEALLHAFAGLWTGERLRDDVLPSIARLTVGLCLSIALGIGIGLVLGMSRVLRRLAEPVLEFFRAVPPPVLVPLLLLLIGINDTMKVAVIVSGAIWPVLLNTVEGVRAVDSVLSDTARTCGVTGWSRVRHLVLPSALPQIMGGVRQCLSIGLILMVISEMFAASSGLGFSIVQFQRTFAIPQMWSGIVLLGLLGIALSLLYQGAERALLPWYRGLKAAQRDI